MSETEITRDYINIRKAFARKNPKAARRIPGFIFNYLERKVHQKELNRLLWKHRDKRDLAFLNAILIDEWGIKVKCHQTENLPATSKMLVVANHPLGGLDGMSLIHALAHKYDEIKFPVNDILYSIPTLRGIFVPVSKHKKHVKGFNFKVVNEAFKSNAAIPYFPAGLVSRKKAGKGIVDAEWKKSFIIGAKENDRIIVPAYIYGKNSNFFYNVGRVRKFFGVKANIEMLYLVDEMIKQRNATIQITFGKPIDPHKLDDSLELTEWAARIKAHCYSLKEDPTREFSYDTASQFPKI